MGYRELLHALEEEVDRQIEERRTAAAQETERILEAVRAQLLAEREALLAEERRRLAEEAARTLSGARLEQQRVLLTEARQQLAELRRAAEARLESMNDPDLLKRLVDELVPELGEGPLVFRVKPGDERRLESHLRENHPELQLRSTVEGSPDARGGVEVTLGRQRLDNTLRSRLESAWRQLEPQIAAMLLQQVQPAPQPGEATPEEAVAVASRAGAGDGEL